MVPADRLRNLSLIFWHSTAARHPKWKIRQMAWQGTKKAHVLLPASRTNATVPPGGRFHLLFDDLCKNLGAKAATKHALDSVKEKVTFAALRNRSLQMARIFAAHGLREGARIGILLDRSADALATVLAASRLGVAYVPLDAGFPAARISYMLRDAEASHVITTKQYLPLFAECRVDTLLPDEEELKDESEWVPSENETSDPIAYIIYTSGTTGHPKGVPIRHSSITQFIRTAAHLYGFHSDDRVFQGMTMAFDFSFEETWVPLVSGATLVPAPNGIKLAGEELAQFIQERKITALCCVPTLLSTIPQVIPGLRLLIVSGEACPPDVIRPWLSNRRRVLNVYGPTETTVSATWTVVKPGSEQGIGGPLPGYSAVIIDPTTGLPVKPGESGELCIGGIGVFEGYLNNPEKTAGAFYHDFIGLPDNPGGRLYRTGDLAKITGKNEIQYLGRIDTQVKIRGYRIELEEIEALARSVDGVGQAIVEPFRSPGSAVSLVAYLTPAVQGRRIDVAEVDRILRRSLPSYMVPAYYEQLDSLPRLPSNKVDRKALPPPKNARFSARDAQACPPQSDTERWLANLLCRVLNLDELSVDADFFEELGADSLSMATFVALTRNEQDRPMISMRDVYTHRTVQKLARWLDTTKSKTSSQSVPTPFAKPSERLRGCALCSRLSERLVFGFGQVCVWLLAAFLFFWALLHATHWFHESRSLGEMLFRGTIAGNLLFWGTGMLMIALKWLVVGRFTTQPIKLWSFSHFRFYVGKFVIRLNPFQIFRGTPLYPPFLRSLGARVGKDLLFMGMPPVCIDLLQIGHRVVIRDDVVMNGYTVADGSIFPGPVVIGDDVLVGEATTLGIYTRLEVGACIGIQSDVPEGTTIVAGASVAGTPVRPTDIPLEQVERRPISPRRKFLYGAFLLILSALITNPLFLSVAAIIGSRTKWIGAHSLTVLLAAGIIYFAILILGICGMLAIPRLLQPLVPADKVFPVYGFRYFIAGLIRLTSNSAHLNHLFGDSSLIVYWLRALGYDLRNSVQTGSNFGLAQKHHSPFLCSFEGKTMVSDGLAIINQETVHGAFILRRINFKRDTFMGNNLHIPASAEPGENCLIATKAALPPSGQLGNGVGILGSPAFPIPRIVERDKRYATPLDPQQLPISLRRKLKANLAGIALYLLRNWVLAGLSLVFLERTFHLTHGLPIPAEAGALSLAAVAALFGSTFVGVFFERLALGFGVLKPYEASLYNPAFWRHERFWKLSHNKDLAIFNGTPFKPFFLRIEGLRCGRNLFDDGAIIAEPTLVSIGDNTTLNQNAVIQCHSLEEGGIKCDRVKIGDRFVAEPMAFIHYGVCIANDCRVGANALMMKGSVATQGSTWNGNPANEQMIST